jgi:hypothetical protein
MSDSGLPPTEGSFRARRCRNLHHPARHGQVCRCCPAAEYSKQPSNWRKAWACVETRRWPPKNVCGGRMSAKRHKWKLVNLQCAARWERICRTELWSGTETATGYELGARPASGLSGWLAGPRCSLGWSRENSRLPRCGVSNALDTMQGFAWWGGFPCRGLWPGGGNGSRLRWNGRRRSGWQIRVAVGARPAPGVQAKGFLVAQRCALLHRRSTTGLHPAIGNSVRVAESEMEPVIGFGTTPELVQGAKLRILRSRVLG